MKYSKKDIKEIIEYGSIKDRVALLSYHSYMIYNGYGPAMTENEMDMLYRNVSQFEESEFNRYIDLLNIATERRDVMFLFAQRLIYHAEHIKQYINDIISFQYQADFINDIISKLEDPVCATISQYIIKANSAGKEVKLKYDKKENRVTVSKRKIESLITQSVKLYSYAIVEAKTIEVSFMNFVDEYKIGFLIPDDIKMVFDTFHMKYDFKEYEIDGKEVKLPDYDNVIPKMEVVNAKPFSYEQ